MRITNTGFKDLRIIAHKSHSDFRGSLRETYNKKIINFYGKCDYSDYLKKMF